MKTHTPGPFHITRNTTPGQFVTETKIRDAHQSVVAVLHVNSEGNGPLFAAAPDLLAALKLCADKLALWPEGSNPEFFPSLKAARAAISKAEGQA